MLRPATHTDHIVAATVQETGSYLQSERTGQAATGHFDNVDDNDSVLLHVTLCSREFKNSRRFERTLSVLNYWIHSLASQKILIFNSPCVINAKSFERRVVHSFCRNLRCELSAMRWHSKIRVGQNASILAFRFFCLRLQKLFKG
jgi:hypothetical protein